MSREWRIWRDSNPQPLGSKPSALSIELQIQCLFLLTGITGQGSKFLREPRNRSAVGVRFPVEAVEIAVAAGPFGQTIPQ